MPEPSRVVTVEIHGQQYPVRSELDPAYVSALATYVDEKMRLAAKETPAADTLRVAVLTALNIADEFFRVRDEQHLERRRLSARAGDLERILDLALGHDERNALAR